MRVEAMRDNDVELVLRSGHRDVKQPALLLDLLRASGSQIRRNAPVDRIEQEHGLPLLPLGGMNGREDQVVLVEMGRTGEIAGGIRRIAASCARSPARTSASSS